MARSWQVCRVLFCVLLVASINASASDLTLMTFNVENLFDSRHDEGKNDETYLPKALKADPRHIAKCNKVRVKRWRDQCLFWDWNETVVDTKLGVIATAIKQVNQGSGPDIIAFQEVENAAILDRLRREYLDGLGYEYATLLEGNDKRGIDVAFLSKYPTQNARLHAIAFSEQQKERIGDTRPILEATFLLPGGERVTGLNVHFPAPYHPKEMRESAYKTLNRIVSQLPEDRAIFAAGDFNTTFAENREFAMLNRWVRPTWQVAHDLCSECPGTSFYPPKNEWSFLDMILWRPTQDWEMTSSYLANDTIEQMTTKGTPKRFSLPEATGVSDHWPLVLSVTTP